LVVRSRAPKIGIFTDISPVADMRLHSIRIEGQPNFKDLSPLKKLSLTSLQVPGTGVESLDSINGSLLEELNISHSLVRDLLPLQSMPKLKELDCSGCPIDSLEPLVATSIQDLMADIRTDRDREVLRKMKHLKIVNQEPLQKFLSRQ
jgi:Leucine-rich repeat (LRR) protein